MLNRLLITGANGGLGRMCRTQAAGLAKTLRLSDRDGLGEAAENEEIVYCDLEDRAAVAALVEGCDGVLHLGGKSIEASWETIRAANIDGMVNLYEAARNATVTPRILFASSNHTIGYYEQSEHLDTKVPTRPDSYYGVSKVFGEALASMYYDKFGVETACVRIGSCFAEPRNHRMLSTWMSQADFILLIERVFAVPRLGCPIIYGASANAASWWDNRAVAYLGWQPQDNAEQHRARIDAQMAPPDPSDDTARFQGGAFCSEGIHED